MKILNYLPFFIIVLAFNFPPILNSESANGCISYILGLTVGLLCFLSALDNNSKRIELGISSILIILFIILLVIIKLYQMKFNFTDLDLIFIIIYFKTLDRNKIEKCFIIFIRLSLVLIFIIVILQLNNIIPSYNSNFEYTGTFLNPNHLAIYLGVLLFSLIVEVKLHSKKNTFIDILNYVLLTIGIILIILLKCRSIYVAIIIALIIVFKDELVKIKKIYFLILTIFFFIICTITYKIKQNSTNGRIYIWKLDLSILKEKPLLGIGANNFQIKFSEKQVSFFHNKQNINQYGKFASQLDYAFCDILQFCIEYGIIIGFLLILIIYIFLRNFSLKDKNLIKISANGSLLILIVSSITNYVFYVEKLKLLFFISLAIVLIFEENTLNQRSPLKTKFFLLPIGLLLIAYSVFSLDTYYDYHNLKNKLLKFNRDKEYDNLIKLYPYLKNNFHYLFDLAVFNNKLHKKDREISIKYLNESRKLYIHRTTNNLLASLYFQNDEYEKALQLYLYNYYAQINNTTPKYILANFYFKTHKTTEFNKMYFEFDKFSDEKSLRYKNHLIYQYKILNP